MATGGVARIIVGIVCAVPSIHINPVKPGATLRRQQFAPHAATVAIAISDHGPFSSRGLIQRAMETAPPPVCAAFAGLELGAEGRPRRHGQEDQRGGIPGRGLVRV